MAANNTVGFGIGFLESSRSPYKKSKKSTRSLTPFVGHTTKALCVVGSLSDINSHVLHRGLVSDCVDPKKLTYKSSISKHGFLEYWEKIFYSIPSQDILNDTFWWFFLYSYKPNPAIQNLLYTRTAENYVLLLTNSTQYHHHYDTFLKFYPGILAQSVYSAFIHSFPNSWNSFDEKFKSDLCNIIYLWFTGLYHFPEEWKKWDFLLLEPESLTKHVQNEQLKPSLSNSITEKKTEKNNSRPMRMSTLKSQLATCIQVPKFQQSVVDIKCNSPLVSHYLQLHGLHRTTGSTFLLKHNCIRQLPCKNSNTYFEVLMKSLQHERKIKTEFQRTYSILRENMKKHSIQRQKIARDHEKITLFLLSNNQEIQRLSNALVTNIFSEQSARARRHKVSNMIEASLLRLTS